MKFMNPTHRWLIVLMTATFLTTALSEAGVGLYNSMLKQVVTSSTLKWTNLKQDKMQNLVIGTESDEGRIYICRAKHNGDMLLGKLQADHNSCTVSPRKTYEVFEVLENIENASLIIWKEWFKFHSKQNGGVLVDSSSDSIFIGRAKAENGNYNIGRISYESTIGNLITFGDEHKDRGEILVEILPTRYELKNVILEKATLHETKSEPKFHSERVLENPGDVAVNVATEVAYSFSDFDTIYTLSWGHGHGIAIGLNTSIQMEDGTMYPSIKWSNPYNEDTKKLFKIEKYLEPGTACNVTIRGYRVKRDIQYTGNLVTYYKDNAERTRTMTGERIEDTVEVEADYSEVYFLSNNTLVPTTTTTTTSTTTTTTTPAPPPAPTAPPAPEENDIPASIVKKEQANDASNMQGDSGEGNQKPQNTEENINKAVVGGLGTNPNSAMTVISSITLLLSMLAILI